ncbi:MAG: ATP-dependent DNA helicase RecG [Berkelbacteria bacterium GW2011_GWA1_36_9]|uniref:ATP-dependent DNA helicase RecG n=1 Tax=Berkelbacteria bacterium GW2011_GWA1_36_9 TaxID=1618331 RepID=A0A0G0FJC8_9BACT|nr:MAG: ATP-dependent DNA helicase RecG [Berkelbacteria bacterium GW2011_GWA1_36_9]
MKLNTPVQYLTGVGPKMAEKLKRLGIETVRDLLFYYPWRYDDFSNPRKISSLRIGEDVIIKAKIVEIKISHTRQRWMTLIEAELSDETGKIKAIWFNQPYLLNILKPDDEWLFAGKVNWDFKSKAKSLAITQYEKEPVILPVYSKTAGLTSKYLRKLIKSILSTSIEEYLPREILEQEKLVGLNEAIGKIHFPKNSTDIELAKKRLGFDELFLIALKMLQNKKELSKSPTIVLAFDEKILKKFVKNLPFKLTNGQRKVAWEIIQDLGKTRPMNRLLEGDVGSGKTVVAAMAVLVASKNKYQSVWLAPTEILANQHFENVSELLAPYKIKVGLMTAANKNANLEKDDLIIGTHALLQKDVEIPNLALIIVDEQHRFGVKQRAHLRKGKLIPHLLSMTATPIPRTLALSLYGDLDLSIIDELPPGRKKVITKVVAFENRQKAYDFIGNEIKKGRQAFVICPLIEKGDSPLAGDCPQLFDADRKSVISEYEKLSKNIFPKFKIGLLHGKMKAKEKEETMKKFHNGKLDILVSTAVVEVGIDVKNATVMMIESAERFGLAQLHQFRGRVGRAEHQSYCFLFSDQLSEITKKRLQAMVSCNNGFELAEIDLQLRGPGELVGIRQSGLPDLKMASLSDTILISKVRQVAEKVIEKGLENYPNLIKKLEESKIERHFE